MAINRDGTPEHQRHHKRHPSGASPANHTDEMSQRRHHVGVSGQEAANQAPTKELLDALGTTISPELLVQALTHRSFSHEHPGAPNYERLEFLGDAVLELVSTETLFKAHPDMTEGQLAKMRAKAVSEESLSAIARDKLHVGRFILLGHGESESGGADKSSILCDIVESLIGATFVEHGIDGAREVVHRLVDDTLREVATEGPALDWKTSLTVLAHHMDLTEPVYRMSVSGPEYAQQFTARAILPGGYGKRWTLPIRDEHGSIAQEGEDPLLGTGSGTSKRKAQLAAAEQAWHTLKQRERDCNRMRAHAGSSDTADVNGSNDGKGISGNSNADDGTATTGTDHATDAA